MVVAALVTVFCTSCWVLAFSPAICHSQAKRRGTGIWYAWDSLRLGAMTVLILRHFWLPGTYAMHPLPQQRGLGRSANACVHRAQQACWSVLR